jgi:tetratricopeptide (TPR) repeat protein
VRALLGRRKPERGKTSGFRASSVVAAALLLGVVPLRPAFAAEDTQAFELGIKAFRAGDFPAALQAFLEARRRGLDTPGLRYDLGATYYRLQRYAEAEGEFQGLARHREWAALALYNLGLIAQRTGRERQAIEYFSRAQLTTNDPGLSALAGTALARLGAPPPRTGAVASLAGGYDSNAALTQDPTAAGISHQGDSFVEALASVSHRLGGDTARASYAYGGLLLRKYRDLTQFDTTGLRAGLSYETDSGRLQTSVGGNLDTAYVGGGRLARGATLDAQARRRTDSGDVRGRYQFAYILGGAGYEYLDGWEQRFTADAGFALASWLVRIGYQLELNNRRDLQQGTDFFSASPTRNSLYATALGSFAGWQTDARGEYRVSRYNDPNVLNGGTLEVTRKDDRVGFALRASRRLTGLWRAFLDYSYYRNQSNLDTYDYSRYQAMVGIEAVFEK